MSENVEAQAEAAPAPTDGDSASRAFLTDLGVRAEPKKEKKAHDRHKYHVLESSSAGMRVTEHHSDLTNLALSLDKRMDALLREHEKDFFLAYKTHMYAVQKDIKTLKMKADHEEEKTRMDTKIKALEGELDWFVTEAVRLDELCRGYKKEVDKWKAKAEALDEDRRFLEDQIKGAKRQNKILRAAAERARSSAYSAMMATKAKTEALERGGGYPGGNDQQLALTAPPDANGARPPRPNSASGGADADRPAVGSGARRVMEARSRTPDSRQALNPLPSSTSEHALSGLGASATLPHVASAGSLGSMARVGHAQSVLGNEAEERYVEAIQHLKESIVREQHNVRMLQAVRATSYSQKSEMEEFFLKCIDEARKELMRKRHMTLYKEKSEKDRVLEAMLNNEDVLVCLYERLFPHRTGIARSLCGPGGEAEDARLLQQMPPESIAVTH